MNSQQKFHRALLIEKALCELMDEEVADCYEVLFEHFGDFINDLKSDYQDELNTEELFLK